MISRTKSKFNAAVVLTNIHARANLTYLLPIPTYLLPLLFYDLLYNSLYGNVTLLSLNYYCYFPIDLLYNMSIHLFYYFVY